ncbi:CCR4-NOT transcription complex subunit 6 [Hydra vulgaris]|uniref:poly(A)-specific ribonuclease n=1 Tax=Hydra vulgaris TaxID=6087 RepID=A0ABM4D8I2_HYDVU
MSKDSDNVNFMLNGHKSEDASDEKPPSQTYWTEIEIVGNTRNLSPMLWTLSHLTGLYLRDNGITRIPGEISKLKNLTKLDLSKNKLRSLPNEIGDMIELTDLNLSYNGLRVLPNEIGRLYRLKALALQGNPLPAEIMSLPLDKLLTLMLDNLTVCPRPPARQWISIEPASTENGSFIVMSYNVLSDKHTNRQLYGYCPQWALNWDYRKSAILKEILQFNADILSLQEVETEQYWNFFLPELKKNGYDGIFNPKSRAKTMPEEERRFVDGCAVFWQNTKFTLIKEHLVEFNQLAAAHAEGADDMVNRVMQRDNICVMALLEMIKPMAELDNIKPKIIVTNAHIHWDPEYRDVKVIQTLMLMRELKKFMDEITAEYKIEKVPNIICADMNSMIDSGAIEFLEHGRIPVSHPDFQKLKYGGYLSRYADKDKKGLEIITHPFNLSRAGKKNPLPFTNFTYDFTGVLDYIFYTSDINLLGELGQIDSEYLKKNKIIGFPHPHFPSDHIYLVVEFDFNLEST